METKELLQKFEDFKASLEAKSKADAKAEVAEQLKTVNAAIEELKGMKPAVTPEEVKAMTEKSEGLQKSFDELAVEFKAVKRGGGKEGKKSFTEAFSELVEKNWDKISNVGSNGKVTIPMSTKDVGIMTVAASVSGDTVINYGNRNAFLPSTRVNLRDLIPTNPSGTLVQAYFRETAGEGGVGVQTEGSAKSQIDFNFSEVKVVNKYIASFVRFSKQLTKAMPWMQTTLPRLLLREFYSASGGENATFYTTVSLAATGSTTTSETDPIKAIIDLISNQRTAKYNASYALVNHATIAALNKLTYTNGYYAASGGVLTRVDGSMEISGVPIIPVDFVADEKILIIDQDFLERVEAESINIQFFEQDSDNVEKNLITARIECLEEINLMMPASAIFATLTLNDL